MTQMLLKPDRRDGATTAPDTGELIVDEFAGGGGASLGIEQALGRPVDICINHDAEAMCLHAANHPESEHLVKDVWEVDPLEATGGRPVGLLWASPDCKHFSKAKGGKPVSKRVRGLAWVVIKWAEKVRPRVIALENVEEFRTWGPLRGGLPCPKQRGRYFRSWVNELRKRGYAVEWRELRACDYGAPTIRKRLFLIARCDGEAIVWPEPTHGPPGSGLLPYRTAAECIDWSHPCPSIFTRRRPLADKTLKRIATGTWKYVINAAEPFIVTNTTGHTGRPVSEPLATVTTGNHHYLTVPYTIPRHGERDGQHPRCRGVDQPAPTVTATANGASLVSAFLTKHYGGVVGHELARPFGTVTARDSHAVSAAFLTKYRGTSKDGQDVREPMATVTSGGNHLAEVRAFLIKYYSSGCGKTGASVNAPAPTVTSRHRLGLVTVAGIDYQIIDIGMRMLTPRELYRAQGFPDDYMIDPLYAETGRPLTKTAQVRMCGNSVCPQMARVLVEANYAPAAVQECVA